MGDERRLCADSACQSLQGASNIRVPHTLLNHRREAALAWEAAFVRLASTQLTAMAEGAGLRLSFSTERSVQDELARESTSGELLRGAA